MPIQEEVKALLAKAALPPGQLLPPGAAREELNQSAFSMSFPLELKEWLSLCNGPPVEPGGLFGVAPAAEWLRIEKHCSLHPTWVDKGWIPIAGDGCGNYYVLDMHTYPDKHPVFFIDHETGYDEPAYVVASNLWLFLRFILENEDLREQGETTYWPFHEPKVLEKDAAIAEFAGRVSLPWER